MCRVTFKEGVSDGHHSPQIFFLGAGIGGEVVLIGLSAKVCSSVQLQVVLAQVG